MPKLKLQNRLTKMSEKAVKMNALFASRIKEFCEIEAAKGFNSCDFPINVDAIEEITSFCKNENLELFVSKPVYGRSIATISWPIIDTEIVCLCDTHKDYSCVNIPNNGCFVCWEIFIRRTMADYYDLSGLYSDTINQWISNKWICLNDLTPLEAIKNGKGLDVYNSIIRMEYGIYD